MHEHHRHHRATLTEIATQAMRERGLEPEFSVAAHEQLTAIAGPATASPPDVVDLTASLWCSIDNDDSRDLDQLSVSEPMPGGGVKVRIAIADVDAVVGIGTPIDDHARTNTTTVYTAARIFSMLPERLSTDLTSLNEKEDRLAVVTEMDFDEDGTLMSSNVMRAVVHNHAQLAYDAVSAWLDGVADEPPASVAVHGLAAQLRAQDTIAQVLRRRRLAAGALELQTIEAKAVFDGDSLVDVRTQPHNRARQLIEEFMIATNGVTARFLANKHRSSLRRVVRAPARWARIVDVARDLGEDLPPVPDSSALEQFLAVRRRADPLRFPDLSLTIVKLLGRGEYAVERPDQQAPGHFGLAVRDYTHSTAPNRRFPDLITARLLKAALAEAPSPYSDDDLDELALHCTERENDADKVERHVRKSAAALLLERRIDERFEGIITGASEKGVWVRIFSPPVEGRIIRRSKGLDVGQRVFVKLLATDVERGFIDFGRVS